jgi:hypothetical protein
MATINIWEALSRFELGLSLIIYGLGAYLALIKRKEIAMWFFKKKQRILKNPENTSFSSLIENESVALITSPNYEGQCSWLLSELNIKTVALVTLDKGEYSRKSLNYRLQLEEKGLKANRFTVTSMSDLDELKKCIKGIVVYYKSIGIDKIIIDITGGTKIFALSGYQVAELEQTYAIYVAMPFVENGKPIYSESEILLIHKPT